MFKYISPLSEVNDYLKGVGHFYQGTRKAHYKVKARRRKANKVARVSRRVNRWKAKGKV